MKPLTRICRFRDSLSFWMSSCPVPPDRRPGPMQVCVCMHQNNPSLDGGTVGSRSASMNCPFQRSAGQSSSRSVSKRSESRLSIMRHLRPVLSEAFRIARFTATFAKVILYLFWRRGFAAASAASAGGLRRLSVDALALQRLRGLRRQPWDRRYVTEYHPRSGDRVTVHFQRDRGGRQAANRKQPFAALRSWRRADSWQATAQQSPSPSRRAGDRVRARFSDVGITKNFSSGNSRTPLPAPFAEYRRILAP